MLPSACPSYPAPPAAHAAPGERLLQQVDGKTIKQSHVKKNTVIQETIRRLSNTSREAPQSLKDSILEDYILMLKNSGYCMREIESWMTPGIVGFTRRLARAKK